MVPDLAAAERICDVSSAEAAVLQSIQRPIVLLRRTGEGARSTSSVSSIAQGRLSASTLQSIAPDVAPGNNYLGVFLPYTPIHHLLFKEGKFAALVMTSGNLSEEPIAITNDEACRRLARLTDFFLVHNRDILLRCDDSVVRVLSSLAKPHGDTTQQLRRSRGFVPVPVFLHEEVPFILAVGGELKNTICLTKGKHAFLSQHIGDLENLESYNFFAEAIAHLQKVLEIKPECIAYDLHPDYFSTQWAQRRTDLPRIGVQHHHAHVASCMAENHLDGQVIGFALDGTGYGTDGNIWGGEVLIATYADFERAAHFEYVPLPGASAAIHEPWRMAVSYLAQHFGNNFKKLKLPFLREVGDAKLELVLRMIERRINSPLTSSCGRLFDAVAAIAGIRNQVSYEAQAAIELEMAISSQLHEDAYRFETVQRDEVLLINTRSMFEELIEDVSRGTPVSEISLKFQNGLVNIFVEIAETLRDRTSLNRVCLSGGTFNNLYLTKNLNAALSAASFEVFTQNEVPAGDGGLSLGQAMVAAFQDVR
jgi:hydrogenase maturation protein HypF